MEQYDVIVVGVGSMGSATLCDWNSSPWPMSCQATQVKAD